MTTKTTKGAVSLPLIYFAFTQKNPLIYMYNMMPAYLIAFGTSSSAAVLPVTIKCAEENNKVHPAISKFVCSTGARFWPGSLCFDCLGALCCRAQCILGLV